MAVWPNDNASPVPGEEPDDTPPPTLDVLKREPYWALQPEPLYNAAIDAAIEGFDLKPACFHERHDIAVVLERVWNAAKLSKFISAMQEELRSSREEIARLREALEPFAESAKELDDNATDKWEIWEMSVAMSITCGDLRRAAKALEG